MLFDLYIENFVLIESINVSFTSGLNIITGETGAGKSIIFKAIDLILGGKTSKDIIKAGKQNAILQGSFDISGKDEIKSVLESNGIYTDDSIIHVSREINKNGRSLTRINGRLVSSQLIKDLSGGLVEITGQHEHQHLLRQQNHIHILDSFGSESISEHLEKVKKCYSKLQELKKELGTIDFSEEEIERKIDLLQFQIDEIDGEKLKPDEDKDLEERYNYLSNFSRITEILQKAKFNIFGDSGAFYEIEKMNDELQGISNFNEELGEFANEFSNVYYSLENLSSQMRQIEDGLSYDDEELYNIEKRLDTINTLKRKYGKTIDDVLAFKGTLEQELQEVQNITSRREQIKKDINDQLENFDATSKKLTKARTEVARRFQEVIEKELHELDLSKAKFAVDIQKYDKITELGVDRVEFNIATNIGDSLKSIGKVASGGELSRIMLAMKLAIGKSDKIPTLIFDEIDTGISGRTASTVGDKISSIADDFQVILVTHLPQIAVHADNHLYIEKVYDESSTVSYIRNLENRDRIYEIGRMLSGDTVTKNSLQNAEDMLMRVKQVRSI